MTHTAPTKPLPRPQAVARCHVCQNPLQTIDPAAGDYCYVFRQKPTCIDCCCLGGGSK